MSIVESADNIATCLTGEPSFPVLDSEPTHKAVVELMSRLEEARERLGQFCVTTGEGEGKGIILVAPIEISDYKLTRHVYAGVGFGLGDAGLALPPGGGFFGLDFLVGFSREGYFSGRKPNIHDWRNLAIYEGNFNKSAPQACRFATILGRARDGYLQHSDEGRLAQLVEEIESALPISNVSIECPKPEEGLGCGPSLFGPLASEDIFMEALTVSLARMRKEKEGTRVNLLSTQAMIVRAGSSLDALGV